MPRVKMQGSVEVTLKKGGTSDREGRATAVDDEKCAFVSLSYSALCAMLCDSSGYQEERACLHRK